MQNNIAVGNTDSSSYITSDLWKFIHTIEYLRVNIERLKRWYISKSSLYNNVHRPYNNKFITYSLSKYANSIIKNNIDVDKIIGFSVYENTFNKLPEFNTCYIAVICTESDELNPVDVQYIDIDDNKRETVIIIDKKLFDDDISIYDSATIIYNIYYKIYESYISIKDTISLNESIGYIALLDFANSTINFWNNRNRNKYNPVLGDVIRASTFSNRFIYTKYTDEEVLKKIFDDDEKEKITVNKNRINTYLSRLSSVLYDKYSIMYDT